MKKHFALVMLGLLFPLLTGAQYYQWRDRDDNFDPPAPTAPPTITFPVQGGATFHDDFGDPRSGGRTHEGNDLMAPKMTPIVAAYGGVVSFAPLAMPSYGYTINIRGDDGYTYNYLHINNDTPGTDDASGGPQYAYAPGIGEGVRVATGQHIAWVGDSGNAEAVGSHLHFEIRMPDGTPINPFPYLNAALQIFTYSVQGAKDSSPTVNSDKGFIVVPETALYCVPGSLIRIQSYAAVYYCGSDGKRYVFPNDKTYKTWYADFSQVQFITPEDMANIQIGGNVTYRPGMKLVKITTDNKVYAVDHGGVLRWVSSTALATKYYGKTWAKQVDDIPDTFFTNYKVGNPINQ